MSAPLSKNTATTPPEDLAQLAAQIKDWGKQLGFDAVGIADLDLQEHEVHLQNWLAKGMHGDMDYMHKHGTKRTRPAELVAGTRRVISVRMDYAPPDIQQAEEKLQQTELGYVSRYALGRDYHKVLRARLKQLAQRINQEIGEFGYRVFTDSAPVMEKALAEKAGLGWIGKHSNLLDSKTGSWFFLGELYIDLPLPVDTAATNHCGTCSRCIDLCPTGAIIGPYQVDARLCISYLTIELRGPIPVPLRSKLGNRIYGCDDCQFVCPWNKFARTTKEPDFSPRTAITDRRLLALFDWSEEEFLKHTEGSAIRRIGHASWQRNIAVALGNANPADDAERAAIISALKDRRPYVDDMVREHIDWALDQHQV
ncbi:epoxyqueuosine reductase [Arenicella chitinivorans]|uniref:Epoxyqueuosine reductase n=1 Tax=Arenicella chitinivorans TaxID=1329800 RepID=A0A918S4X3_9GAMM|nr:tRNA epoxyqueuosine(34) reductase QueG [Arenicella chitinivorans]GHA21497.1 epoxyqueuosine reductase [Arenicella chitinivorans]